MVTVTQVDAALYEIPVEMPYREDPVRSPYVISSVETDTSITGYGLTGMLWPRASMGYIREDIAPILEGENPTETERIIELLQGELNPRYQGGLWSTAVSAIDIALWDIKGKLYEEPVWRLLGGAQNPVPTYVTFGLLEYTEAQVVEVAEDLVSKGETRLKLRVGGRDDPDLRADASRIGAVRDAIGDDVELMIDANHSYSINEAIELSNRVERHDITWFEEPIKSNDVQLLADFRTRTRIPTAIGQNEGRLDRHREFMEHGAVDVIQPNVCFVGGYTRGKAVASTAQGFNRKIANGGAYPHHNMHLQAAVPNGWRVEFHDHGYKAGELIYQDTPESTAGEVTLGEKPGLGLEPDWDAIEEYRVA